MHNTVCFIFQGQVRIISNFFSPLPFYLVSSEEVLVFLFLFLPFINRVEIIWILEEFR